MIDGKPLFFIIFIASKISIGGKAIFSQYRPGKNGKVFKLYKFRSMTDKTDENGILLPDEERITKFGKFIRKTSIDELPQLINILKGEMSFIGPRPALWNQNDLIVERDKYGANSIKPGLTGLAQINGRDELEIPIKAKFDGGIITEMEYNEFRSIVSAAEYEFFMSGFIKRGRCNIQKSI